MLTLEEFRKTRREVPDIGAEIEKNGGWVDGDVKGQRGFLYAGDVYMTITDEQPERYIGLTLTGWDLHRAESELPMLEERLYEWAVANGALGPLPPEPVDPTTVVTYTVIMVCNDGTQTPIGENGVAAFFPFHDWEIACDAISVAVGNVGAAHVHAITRTKVRKTNGEIAEFGVTSFRADGPNPMNVIRDGRTFDLSMGRGRG
jgi:hypothetical protein